jgi:hypothetical protein
LFVFNVKVAHVDYSNSGVSYFEDLCHDEIKYQKGLLSVIAVLEPFANEFKDIQDIIDGCRRLIDITSNLKISDSLDFAIVSRTPEICSRYGIYFSHYEKLLDNIDFFKQKSNNLSFLLDVNRND